MGFFQAFTEILLITGTSWISWWIPEYPHKDMQNPNELTSSSIFSAFHMDVTLSVSLEEPVPTFINTTLPLSYEQKNIMTHSANIYKHILSKSQKKVSTDWQRKLPSTPTQHGTSLLSYRWPSGRWEVGLSTGTLRRSGSLFYCGQTAIPLILKRFGLDHTRFISHMFRSTSARL